jgi:hypothetical protein
MEEDEKLKAYDERKAKVDEYYKNRKKSNIGRKIGKLLDTVVDTVKKEVNNTKSNPPAMFKKDDNPMFNNKGKW